MKYLEFSDKTISLETFMDKLTDILVPKLVLAMKSPPTERVSKNAAIKMCGRGNIDRWIRTGKLEPVKVTPGKHEFLVKDLLRLKSVQQDYFDV